MAAKLGVKLRKRLDEMYEKYEIIGDVRGRGPMLALELVEDRKSKKPAKTATASIMKDCLGNGLLTLKAGLYGNCLRLHPPLVIEDDLLDMGMNILEQALKRA